MYLYKNRLIKGFIKKTVGAVFRAIFAVFAFLNLQYALLAVVVGAILYFTGALNNKALFYAYIGLIGLLVLLGIFLSLRKLFKRKRDRREETVPVKVIERERDYVPVKGHPGYYMVDCGEKVELYKETENGMRFIREDPKKGVGREL